jgi:hypothetical protein
MSLQSWAWLVDEVNDRATLGHPGVRDPEARCDAFDPVADIDWLGLRRTSPGDGDCHSDGHYLCLGCSRLRDDERAREMLRGEA